MNVDNGTRSLEAGSSIAILSPTGTIRRKGPLKVLSWNVQHGNDTTGDAKTDDESFSNMLRECPIFCLQETKTKISLTDYHCFNQSRKDPGSGGLCVGIQKTLAESFTVLDTQCTDIQAVKVKFIDESDTLTIINAYDSPEHSSYKARRKANHVGDDKTLEYLLDFIAGNITGDIFLAGDFNARTKNLNYNQESDEEFDLSTHNSGPSDSKRQSKDSVINKRGKLFLDFLASTNLSLLNGCTVGDIFGEYTSVNYNGKSVVDYIAVSKDLKSQIAWFKVGDLTAFSDHKPCYCALKINYDSTNSDALIRDRSHIT